MKDLVIAGAGGFGREVAWLVEDINAEAPAWNLLGFLDDDPRNVGRVLNGHEVVGTTQWLAGRPTVHTVCAIGDPVAKRWAVRSTASVDARFATLIHPSVHISRLVSVGPGTIICAGSVVTVNVTIGSHVSINPDCTVGHDSVLEDFVSLMPGVHVAGNVNLGEGVYLGTGAAVIHEMTVGPWSVIGAGAVVTSPIPTNVVAVGVPAKVIKPHVVEELPDTAEMGFSHAR